MKSHVASFEWYGKGLAQATCEVNDFQKRSMLSVAGLATAQSLDCYAKYLG